MDGDLLTGLMWCFIELMIKLVLNVYESKIRKKKLD